MSTNYVYISKTQHYLKVKKPLLERQRRARINKCLDALKILVAEFQNDDAIMRMDKAEMLESTIAFMRTQRNNAAPSTTATTTALMPMDSFRNGYMNAVNEVSRVMASTPGICVQVGKSVMTHLGCEFNRLLQESTRTSAAAQPKHVNAICSSPPMSPASSGYHSDCDESSSLPSPVKKNYLTVAAAVWRPW